MKTMRQRLFFWPLLLGLACLLTTAVSAGPPENGQQTSGTLAAVNVKDRTVTLKGFWSSKTYNLGEGCQLEIPNNPNPQIADLHPGHQVDITYQTVNGIPVVSHLVQEDLIVIGDIESLDVDKRTLVIGLGSRAKTFAITEKCKFIDRNNSETKIEEFKVGNRVNVIYDLDGTTMSAYRIEKRSELYTGDLDAVDLSAHTIKAKFLLTNKRFILGEDCVIIVNGKKGASVSDLRLGKSTDISYENVNGVFVAHRIRQPAI